MTRRLVLAHLAGNALLLWLGYYWLGLGESRAAAVAWSAAVALFIVAGACWLHGSAYARSFRIALRNLPWTVIVAGLALTAYALLPSGKWWWVARWIALPLVFAPLFAGAAAHGWRAHRGFSRRAIVAPALVFAGVWVPLRLLTWTPRFSSFAMEMTSFVARAIVAYLLFLAASLLLARITSAGSPRFSQSKIASLP